MKKLLLVLAVIAVLLAGGVALFLSTFDLDRYKPMIIQKASEAIGAPVEIDRLSLGWSNGIALKISGLKVRTGEGSREEFMSVNEAGAVLRLGPLLQKKIEIASVAIRAPRIQLVKGPDGKVRLPAPKPGASSASAPAKGGAQAPVLPFSVDSFQLRDGQIEYKDLTSDPPMNVSIEELDVDVKDFSLTKPFQYRMRASLFGRNQNLRSEGTVRLPGASGAGALEDLVFFTDLADLDMIALTSAVPGAKAIAGQPEGTLNLKIDRFELGESGPGPAKGRVQVLNGRLLPSSSKSAFENIKLDADLEGPDLRLGIFSADYAGGTLKANGVIKDWRGAALSGFTGNVQGLQLERIMPSTGAGSHLNGKLSLGITGQAAGLSWPQMSQTLAGEGVVRLENGVIADFNLVKKVIEKISILPGAENMILKNLPDAYRAKLNEPHTILKPAELPFVIQNGFMLFDRLVLATDLLAVQGGGQVGLLDKNLSARASVLLEPPFSAMIISAMPQVQLLANSRGQIELPVQITGRLPQISVTPDSDYIAQKLLTSQLTNFVENPQQSIQQVRNLLDKPMDAGESGVKNTLAGILQAIGQENSGTEGSPQ